MSKQPTVGARRSGSPPPKRLGRPPGQSSDSTRQAILAAARDSFAALGFGSSTTRDIAAAAGVTAAALYRHFPSKPELYAAVVHDALAELIPRLQRAVAGQASVRASFRALIEVVGALDAGQRAAARFLSELPMEMQRHPEVARSILADPGEVYTLVNSIVAAGVRSGEIARANAPHTVSVMIASFMGMSAYLNTLGPVLGKHAVEGFVALIEGQLFGPAQH